MQKSFVHALGAALLLFAVPMLAHAELEPDAENCKDSGLLTRMPGCRIKECDSNEFDSKDVQTGPCDGDGCKPKTLEGRFERVTYECPKKFSPLQLERNSEAALKKAGFSTVYVGKGGADNPMVTMRKGPQWVEIQTQGDDAGIGMTTYTQTAVLEKKMEQDMEATADSLADEIRKSGHVAVYGINFATGKATLAPESEKILTEIATLLKNNADWKLGVEGHTDNVGGKVANQKLSEQRAAAVVTWLTSNGVAKARLTSKGFGDSKPIADNATDEGKAKNRRVELVKPK